MSRLLFPSMVVVVASAMSACATSDHDALAKKDTTSASTSSSGGSGGESASAVASASTGAGGAGPVEPDVESKLTLVNGLVDEATVRFCLVRVTGPTSELPWPSSSGLDFARSAAIAPTALPAGDLVVKAVVGSTSAVGSKTCAALETAPNVRVLELGLLPESALAMPRHLIVVATGCVGGADHDGPDAELACGVGYAPDTPTASLVAGVQSGLGATDAVRLQFVHGVTAMTFPAKVSLAPGVDSAAFDAVLYDWTLGAVSPNPPLDTESVMDFVDIAKAKLGVIHNGAQVEVPFAQAFENGGVDPSVIADGDGLALVAVGARPGLESASWWRGFTAVAIHQPM